MILKLIISILKQSDHQDLVILYISACVFCPDRSGLLVKWLIRMS